VSNTLPVTLNVLVFLALMSLQQSSRFVRIFSGVARVEDMGEGPVCPVVGGKYYQITVTAVLQRISHMVHRAEIKYDYTKNNLVYIGISW